MPYRNGTWVPMSVVRSQLSAAVGRLQQYCHRQAFNFRIQSLGAACIKQLQHRLAMLAISPGVHSADTMALLPGINVHDELHLYVKDESTIESVNGVTRETTGEMSEDMNVPILFSFSTVQSWADKT